MTANVATRLAELHHPDGQQEHANCTVEGVGFRVKIHALEDLFDIARVDTFDPGYSYFF